MEKQSIPKGIVYVILSAMVLVPMVSASIKHLGSNYGVVEIVWARALGQTIWMVMLLVPRHGWRVLKTKQLGLQLLRSAILFISTICFVLGVVTVPLVTAHVIGFIAPMVVVALSAIFLAEKVGLIRWVAVLLGFLGILIILQPGTSSGLPLGALWLLIGSVCWSIVQILSRKISSKDHSETTTIYTYIVALFVMTPLLPGSLDFAVSPTNSDWLAFILIGLVGGMRHYCSIKAYALAPASIIAPFNYTELLGATLIGAFIFGVMPNGITWLGTLVIIVAGLYLAYSEQNR